MSNEQNGLSAWSTKQLEEELLRGRKPPKPDPHFPPDTHNLVHLIVQEGVPFLEAKGRWPKDFEHHVYEAAIEAIYGPEFWPWMVSVKKNFTPIHIAGGET